jgi:hypothetical protein
LSTTKEVTAMKEQKIKPTKKVSIESYESEIHKLETSIKNMIRLSDLIVSEGGPEEICDLIKQQGQRALDSSKRLH